MAEVLAKTTFSSVIHNNEVCDEIVKWGNANGYPVTKAKLQNKLDAYVGFSPEYMVRMDSRLEELEEIIKKHREQNEKRGNNE